MIQYALTDSANIFWSLSMYDNTILVATPAVGNTRTLPNSVIVSGSNGYNYQMTFVQDAIGGRSISFDSNFKVIGSFDLAPNKRTLITVVKQDGEADVILTPLTTLGTVGNLTIDSFTTGILSKTANYTISSNDSTIECTANTFTVTLPTAVGIAGRVINIKNTGSGLITIDANSTQTIDGALTQVISQWENLTIQSNGTNWIIL